MTIRWNFPNYGYGQIRGISDAGIETFTGNEIQALAREICQNSLDASANNDKPVKVEFERIKIKSRCIPGYEEYKNNIEKAYNYWKNRDNKKTNEYLSKANAAIKREDCNVLRISDYNTTGLSDPFGDSDKGWNSLTKIDGGATKSGDKAGAFGIGKNAPFCNSAYRLVYYRTLNEDNQIAAQGISRFVSFPMNEDDAKNTLTTGFGYYGNPDGNSPVNSIKELENLNKREAIGTDVFVYGFRAKNTWAEEVTSEIINNFLMSMYKNKLEVKVDNDILNNSTLDIIYEKYKDKLKQSYDSYRVLTDQNTKDFSYNFHGMGTLKLKVLIDPNGKLNRKVLVTRSSGMKLFNLGNVSKLLSFSAILEMEGTKLNEYFREMETPSHDKWVPGRYVDPGQAKEYYDELKSWVKNTILKLGEKESIDQIMVEGLSNVLQNNGGQLENNSDETKETIVESLDKIVIQESVISSQKYRGLFFGAEGEGQSKKRSTKGQVGKGRESTAIRHLGGTRKRKKSQKHIGSVGGNEHDSVEERFGGDSNIPLEGVRIVNTGKGEYRISFTLPRDVYQGHIEVVAIGENGKSNVLHIKSSKGIKNCENVFTNINGILFSSILGEEKTVISFSLYDDRNYAMEVNVYEHN